MSRRFLILLCFLTSPVTASENSGRVVSVQDGDTLTVLVDRRQVRIRLKDIDAPEKKQAFGERSRQSLAELCFEKQAAFDDARKDRYGRVVARVTCAHTDAALAQVRRGMAWVFDRYVEDRSLYDLQQEARLNRNGLWQEANPIPPWQWRRMDAKAKSKKVE